MPEPTAKECRQAAFDLIDTASHYPLESPRRLVFLAEAQVYATLALSLTPATQGATRKPPTKKEPTK